MVSLLLIFSSLFFLSFSSLLLFSFCYALFSLLIFLFLSVFFSFLFFLLSSFTSTLLFSLSLPPPFLSLSIYTSNILCSYWFHIAIHMKKKWSEKNKYIIFKHDILVLMFKEKGKNKQDKDAVFIAQ